MNGNKIKLIDTARSKLTQLGYSPKTMKCYLDWIYRFMFFHENSAPSSWCEKEIADFMEFQRKECKVASTTLKQALSALHFLYGNVLHIPINDSNTKNLKNSTKEPTILTRKEIQRILSSLRGEKKLMVSMLYGCGFSLSECIQMRVRNIDFSNRKITVADESGKDTRKTIIPKSLVKPLHLQMEKVHILFEENIAYQNFHGVLLPLSGKNESQNVSKEFCWQYIFPSKTPHYNKTTGKLIQYPVSESSLQKTIKEVLHKCNICKSVCCHTFRHSFATHLLENGYDIHLVQKLLGHKNIHSTTIYQKLAKKDQSNIISPLDSLYN